VGARIKNAVAYIRKVARRLFVLPSDRLDPTGSEWGWEKWPPLVGLLLFLIPRAIRDVPAVWRYTCDALTWFGLLFLAFTWPPSMRRIPRGTRLVLALLLSVVVGYIAYKPMIAGWKEEKASALSGVLEAEASQDSNSLPVIQFGPESDGTRFAWAGLKDTAQLKVMGENFFVRQDNGKLYLSVIQTAQPSFKS
jgi:hypothetical protein